MHNRSTPSLHKKIHDIISYSYLARFHVHYSTVPARRVVCPPYIAYLSTTPNTSLVSQHSDRLLACPKSTLAHAQTTSPSSPLPAVMQKIRAVRILVQSMMSRSA